MLPRRAVREPSSEPAPSVGASLPWERGWCARHPRTLMLLGALASAVLFALAFPTTELSPLAFVALTPLLALVRTRTRWQRLRAGWLVGFVVELVLFRWIPFTMTEMTSIAGPLTLGMWGLYALWHGLRLGLFALVAEPLRRAVAARSPALSSVAVALCYVVVEWAFPVIFPWALGHAVWELPGAGAVLALQGVPLLTFCVALVNAGLADAFALRAEPRRRALLGAAIALLVVLAPAFVLAPEASGRTLRAAILQPNYTLAEKKHADVAMRRQLLDRLEAQLRALPRGAVDLVIASEGAFPMWWRLDSRAAPGPGSAPSAEGSAALLDPTHRIQRAVAEGPAAHAIIGGLRRDDDRRTRNSAVHIGPDGSILGHYDKQTLVPFSEYAPLADVFPFLKEIRGIGNLQPGDQPCAFTLEGVPGHAGGDEALRVACGICYESLFADATRRDADAADLLVNLTIDTWFGATTAPRMHLMTQASRAAELGIPLLRSALTGISGWVDHAGRVIEVLPRDVPGVLSATVTLGTGSSAFRSLGQLFAPIAAGLVLTGLIDAWRRRRVREPAAPPPGQA